MEGQFFMGLDSDQMAGISNGISQGNSELLLLVCLHPEALGAKDQAPVSAA